MQSDGGSIVSLGTKLLALATASMMKENSFFCQVGQRAADLEGLRINSSGKNAG